MTVSRTDRAAGFTLIEVLVAFAIAALLIVPILRLISLGLGAFERTQNYATAALWAQSVLANDGVQSPIVEGVQSGDLPERIHWELSTEPYHDDQMSSRPLTNGFVAYALTLKMSWPSRFPQNSVTFYTLRLAPPPKSQ